MTNITITQEDFNDLAWMATRYALGRKTYVVGGLCKILIKHSQDLFDGNKAQTAYEIQQAIEKEEAGMPMDVAEWKKVLKTFRDKNETN